VDTVSPLLPDEDVVKLTLASAGTDIGPQFAFPLLEDGVRYDEAFLSGWFSKKLAIPVGVLVENKGAIIYPNVSIEVTQYDENIVWWH